MAEGALEGVLGEEPEGIWEVENRVGYGNFDS